MAAFIGYARRRMWPLQHAAEHAPEGQGQGGAVAQGGGCAERLPWPTCGGDDGDAGYSGHGVLVRLLTARSTAVHGRPHSFRERLLVLCGLAIDPSACDCSDPPAYPRPLEGTFEAPRRGRAPVAWVVAHARRLFNLSSQERQLPSLV